MTQQPLPSSSDLARFAAAVRRHLGLEMSEAPAAMLAAVLARHASQSGVATWLRAIEEPSLPPALRRCLAQDLTVGESYFFRNAEQFAALVDVALPAALSRRQGGAVRVLSAGCAAGEEAYSIAMVMRELGMPSVIRACDLNPDALSRAAAGRYTAWSLRELPARHRHWFRPDGDSVVLDPTIRRAVQFEEINLVDPCSTLFLTGAFDIVFCRNMMMYLTREHAVALVGRLARSLAPEGHLFVGHAESLRGMTDDLVLVHTHNTFYYRRRSDIGGASTLARPSAPRVVPQVPVAPPAASDDASVHRVLQCLAAERFGDAETLLATAPPSLEARLLAVMLLVHRGRYREALERSGALPPEEHASAEHRYVRGLCRDAAGEWARAAEDYREAAARDERFAMPWLQLGILARRRSERSEAARCFEAASALLPVETEAHLRLFGGGFGRAALIALCRAELQRLVPMESRNE